MLHQPRPLQYFILVKKFYNGSFPHYSRCLKHATTTPTPATYAYECECRYFHNYSALLERLEVEHTDVGLGFHIRDDKGREFIQGKPDSPLIVHHRQSLDRWEKMLGFVRRVNSVFNWFPSRPSLYDLNMLNPLNLLPLRWLSILFGVSSECWDDIIVPM